MANPKVLIVARYHDILTTRLNEMGYRCVFKEALPYDSALKEIKEYEGLVTSNHLPVDRQLLDAAKKLRWVGRLGSGMEIVDVEYATRKGIACFSSPEGNANAVAEQALGMLLALKHHILKGHLAIGNQEWPREENRGHEIEGKTAGLIGTGNNGYRFAQKLMAMDMKVLAFDKFRNNYDKKGIIGCKDLSPLLEEADVLSFHVPLNEETRHYFDEVMLEKMKKPFVLLNLSRGPVVSQRAVFKGMKSGKILGAALDVWEEEPFWKNKESEICLLAEELMKMPNFIGTPHIGGYTFEALYKMSKVLADKVEHFVSHK